MEVTTEMPNTEGTVANVSAVVEPIVITEEMVEKARRAGDLEGLRKISEQLSNPAPEKKLDVVSVSGDQSSQATAQQKKKFSTKYKGQVVEYDDDNNYLGKENFGQLKKEYIINSEKVKELENEKNQSRTYAEQKHFEAEQARAENARLKKEYDDAMAKLKAYSDKQSAVDQVSPQHQSFSAPVNKPVKPIAPDLPNNVIDWTEEQVYASKKYQSDLAEYASGIAEYFDSKLSMKSTGTDSETARQIAEMRNDIDSYKKAAAELEQQKAEEKRRLHIKQQDEVLYGDISSFQKTHSGFATPKPIHELDLEVKGWMDKVANSCGIALPYGATPDQRAQYENAKATVVGQFLAGDEKVLDVAEMVKPPEGYKEYFEIAKLYDAKSKMIKEGLATDKTPLHKIWLWQADDSGDIDKGTQMLQADAMNKGVESTIKTMALQGQDTAVRLPNSTDSVPVSNDVTAQDDEQIRALAMEGPRGIKKIQSNPLLAAKYAIWKSQFET